MKFRLRNKKFFVKNDSSKNIYFSIAVIFFIIIFSLPWSRNMIFNAGFPLWTIRNKVNSFFSNNIEILNSKENLLKYNSLLREQIIEKNEKLILFDVLKKENEELKNILNRNKTNQKFLLGTVLVKPFLSAYDTLIVDVGSSDGVKINDQVLTEGSIFIGYISEVYDKTSKITLYSSYGEKAKILIGSSNIEKEAIGLGGGNFKVEIPRGIEVKEGDPVIIPSISTNVFGTVDKIEFKESDSFQTVLFKSPVNIAELKWVEILALPAD